MKIAGLTEDQEEALEDFLLDLDDGRIADWLDLMYADDGSPSSERLEDDLAEWWEDELFPEIEDTLGDDLEKAQIDSVRKEVRVRVLGIARDTIGVED